MAQTRSNKRGLLKTSNSDALVYNEGVASFSEQTQTSKIKVLSMAKPEKNIQVKILRNTMAGGEVARVGSVVTLPENEAKYLIGIGKAEDAPKGARDSREDKPAPAAADTGKGKKTGTEA